jgi:hypothetical protein
MESITTERPQEFSLVLGGPAFQLYRRLHLSGDTLEFLPRRMLVIALFAWLPLLLLSVIGGTAFGGALNIPFFHDIEAHVRFLVALPALILAEVVVQARISPMIQRFVDRRIVASEDMPAFKRAVDSTVRIRNSIFLELTTLVLVYTVGLWIWRSQISTGTPTWYATPDAEHLNLSLAGYWYVFASIPLFQFFLLRWYLRLCIWFRLLWKISRLDLRLTAAHPDKAGGIGFLGGISFAFAPFVFAQGALLSGLIARKVLFEGQSLMSFKVDAIGFVCLFVLIILGPLVMFFPLLDKTQRKGKAEYGLLANRYVFGFEDRWIHGAAPKTDELLGTPDLQSLADLGNSYSFVGATRWVPFGTDDIVRLVAAAAAPLVPLGLIIFSAEELVTRLVKIIF